MKLMKMIRSRATRLMTIRNRATRVSNGAQSQHKVDEIWDLEFKLMNYISYDVCRDGIDEVEFLVKNQGGIEKAQTSENDIVKMVCVC